MEATQFTQPIINMFRHLILSNSGIETHQSKPSDIIINTFPKSGTALAQQMCYQIAVLSGGASKEDPTGMEFDDIATAVPWIEKMKPLNMSDSKVTPRIYKTHRSVSAFEDLGMSSKYIVIGRNPQVFAASFLNFLFPVEYPEVDQSTLSEDIKKDCVQHLTDGTLLSPASDSIDIGKWHYHLKDGSQPPRENILVLFYEDMVKDMKNTVIRVSKFMECHLTDKNVDTVVERCDRHYMATDPKFDGHFEQNAMGVSNKPQHTFPEGFQGFKKYKISEEQAKLLEEMNVKAFGEKTYEEIRQLINEEQHQLHGF